MASEVQPRRARQLFFSSLEERVFNLLLSASKLGAQRAFKQV
jgi:hypothetical protein